MLGGLFSTNSFKQTKTIQRGDGNRSRQKVVFFTEAVMAVSTSHLSQTKRKKGQHVRFVISDGQTSLYQ